jgi:hypothetical protein
MAVEEDDLLNVRQAAEALDVHENTVRNWARSGLLPTAKLPGSRFHRFYRRDVERLRDQRGADIVSREQEYRAIGPELVDATQLSMWAGTRDAQGRFPELVRRLLAATPGVTNISARAGEGVALEGWDARADSSGAQYLPSGALRFELGVGSKPKTKAEEDYAKRRKAPNAKELTFVFMTPRRWRDGATWAEEKERLGDFAAVRVLDADDLDGWLTATPAVHHWISERLGLRPKDAQTLEQWWDQFSARTNPSLPADLFTTGRDPEAARFKEFLNGAPSAMAIQADWRDDALAFIAVVLPGLEISTTAPPVIVTSKIVWDRILDQPGRATLIPLFEEPDLARATERGHHVVTPLGREQVVAGTPVALPRPDRLGAVQALEAAGVSHDTAYHRAALARRSMPALVRRMARDQGFARPPWSEPPDASVLAPLLLIGSWTDRDGDRQVASHMAQQEWAALERVLLHLSRRNDPPFVRVGDQWHVASSEEAFLILGHTLTQGDLVRWRELAVNVIVEPDPVLGLAVEERPMAGLRGIGREHSPVLRRGIAEGVALVGSHEDEAMSDAATASEHADAVVRQILQRANDDSSGRTWWSLADVLPLLAEAAPQIFLDVVHDDLDAERPILATMFQDKDRDHWLYGSSPHSGLLWALETLCWAPEYMLDATRALGRLQAVDPGGRLGNRPLESLKSVLAGWIRHTAAPLDAKKTAIDAIARESATVGWDLIIGVWPGYQAALMPPHSPRFRDWSPDARGVMVSDWLDFIHHLVDRAIDMTAAEPARWSPLIGHLSPLPPPERERLIDTLASRLPDITLSDSDQLDLWESLQDEIGRHRQFSDADWAMDESTLKRLEGLADGIEPRESVERFAHLFDWRPKLPDVDVHDFQAREARLRELRKQAVEDTLQSAGVDGLRTLAHRSQVPGLLGQAVGEVAPDDLRPELVSWLDHPDDNLQAVAFTWARARMFRDDGVFWLRTTLAMQETRRPDRRISLALASPVKSSFWDVLDETDSSLADAYWSKVTTWGVEPDDTERAVRALVAHGRPWIAVDILAAGLHRPDKPDVRSYVDPELIYEVLNAALAADPRDAQSQSLGYELGVVLDYLETRGATAHTIARYEFAFFQLLEHHRAPTALFRALADEPEQFVDLVSRVYRGENQPPEKPTQQEVAMAHHAWWVLQNWHGIPGLLDGGIVDAEHLTKWVRTARLAFADTGRTEIGDELIGQTLASSPIGSDGAWPAEPVREIVEATGSQALESGIHSGVVNKEGVTSRGVFDGGSQERDRATRYREWASQVAPEWPRTARMLRTLADSYKRRARREDLEADVRANTE